MIWTNAHNIAEGMCLAIRNFVEGDDHGKDWSKVSVTELCDSPLRRFLKLKHGDEVTVDYADYLWAILGSAVHYILSLNKEPDVIIETQMKVKDACGLSITGRADRIDLRKDKLEDYKVTSLYTFKKNLHKEDWAAQLNVYAWLCKQYGINIEHLQINAILRDHSKVKAITEKMKGFEYPEIPFQNVEVPLWTPEEQLQYIKDRLAIHLLYNQDSNVGNVPTCTAKQRWHKVDQYAVIKKGAKRSMKNFNVVDNDKRRALLEAQGYMQHKGLREDEHEIQTRGAEDMRCRYYCEFTEFCPYYKQYVKE